MVEIKCINCGERNIQTMYRVSIKDICDKYGINIGDSVEVFIKIPNGRCELLEAI